MRQLLRHEREPECSTVYISVSCLLLAHDSRGLSQVETKKLLIKPEQIHKIIFTERFTGTLYVRTPYAKHTSRKPLKTWAQQQLMEKTKKWINTAICQTITILCLWGLRPMALMFLKASSQSSKQAKKIRTLLVKNCLPFSYFKVHQWQYNEAMQFVLWLAKKIDLQAQRSYLILSGWGPTSLSCHQWSFEKTSNGKY